MEQKFVTKAAYEKKVLSLENKIEKLEAKLLKALDKLDAKFDDKLSNLEDDLSNTEETLIVKINNVLEITETKQNVEGSFGCSCDDSEE